MSDRYNFLNRGPSAPHNLLVHGFDLGVLENIPIMEQKKNKEKKTQVHHIGKFDGTMQATRVHRILHCTRGNNIGRSDDKI